MDLRKSFVDNLIKLAERDKKIILFTCDLGFSFLERFAEKFPNRYKNMGICEQNAIGVAAGLALGGFKPYVYSNAIFLLMRAYEQVRDEVCYNNLGVILCGTGASGFLGFSHNCNPANEDELILKHLPNLQLYFPKDKIELNDIMNKSYKSKSPAYIRI